MPFGPIVAGQFYNSNARELSEEIDEYLTQAVIAEDPRSVFGLISPHAGYVYSGPVAAYAYKMVSGRKDYDVIVVIGLSHRATGDVSVLDADSYRTPLGEVPIDRELSRKLISRERFIDDNKRLFAAEHSLEVQIPFIQKTLPGIPLVLVSMRTISADKCRRLAAALRTTFKDRHPLYVASTDMSHFLKYHEAAEADLDTLESVKKMDFDALYLEMDTGANVMCGIAPVMTVLELFKQLGGSQVEVLKYMNSGDTAGPRNSVVGYAAVALLNDETRQATKTHDEPEGKFLSNADQRKCLEIARRSIESYIRDHKVAEISDVPPALERPGAAFVSLHKRGNLRGCVGQIEAREPLWMSIRDMAVAAATQDTRFPSLRKEEIEDLDIEISVMTPMEDVDDPEKIVVGTDGLMISRGFYRGLLLPQVPGDYGWTREQYLEHTCLKAGLPADAWRDPKTTIQKFQAQVFGEADLD